MKKRQIPNWLQTFGFLMLSLFILHLEACQTDSSTGGGQEGTNTQTKSPTQAKPKVSVPSFKSDSAYAFIQKQVDFGPRVPGTTAHKACADWMEAKLKTYTKDVMVQQAQVKVYDGRQVPMYNVIASFNPNEKKRILLCAHWDTRPFADQDDERQDEPILGANDGGSGVGVLIEIARQLSETPANVGVDIILFDVEDWGQSSGAPNTYCLGSQYWGKNLHKPNYKAKFGILLDMVGAKNAVFLQEQHSMNFASSVVKKVWDTANEIGFSSYFLYQRVPSVTDDHYYVNTLAKIPTIDIIQYDPQISPKGFGHFWHTHDDNMDIIDKHVLEAVGQTVLTVIYREGANS